MRIAQGRVDGKKQGVTGIDQRTFPDLYHAGWKQGDDATLRALGDGDGDRQQEVRRGQRRQGRRRR